MPAEKLGTLDVRTRQQWRNWLRKHHDSESGIWLVCQKRRTAEKSISYDGAVEEALCFGWIDSIVKRLDEDRYLRKFTPRKPESRWSTINCHRYAKLKASGLLATPGLERAPTERSGDAPRPSVSVIPSYIENTIEGQCACARLFRAAGTIIPTRIHRLDRFGQTRGNEGETPSRSSESAGGW